MNHSIIKRVGRARITIDVPSSPSDAGTEKPARVILNSNAHGFDHKVTFLDSTEPDFGLGSSNTYDLGLAGGSNGAPDDYIGPVIDIEDVADITGITIKAYPDDNLFISKIALTLDNTKVFEKEFNPPFEVKDSGYLGGTSLIIGFDELRSNYPPPRPEWNDIYLTGTAGFIGFTAEEFKKKLDSVLGNVLRKAGGYYHNPHLKDGPTTELVTLTEDRLRVQQQIIASEGEGVECILNYDLQIIAKDINGNIVDFSNNPVQPNGFGLIYTTEIHVENPDPGCDAALWKEILNGLGAAVGFEDKLGNLERDLKRGLEAVAPSSITSSPPINLHFCFPKTSGGLEFRNGGVTLCAG